MGACQWSFQAIVYLRAEEGESACTSSTDPEALRNKKSEWYYVEVTRRKGISYMGILKRGVAADGGFPRGSDFVFWAVAPRIGRVMIQIQYQL